MRGQKVSNDIKDCKNNEFSPLKFVGLELIKEEYCQYNTKAFLINALSGIVPYYLEDFNTSLQIV